MTRYDSSGAPLRLEFGPEENYEANESACDLQGKFGLILITLPIQYVAQLAYRILDLRNVCRRGYRRAEENHLVNMKREANLIGSAIPVCDIVCSILWQLIASVCQIVFINVYINVVAVVAFVGVFLPRDARRLMSRMDELFYIQPLDPYAPASLFEYFGNLSSVSMQRLEFQAEQNLYRFSSSYAPNSAESLRLRLQHEIVKARQYYNYDFEPLLTSLHQIKDRMEKLPFYGQLKLSAFQKNQLSSSERLNISELEVQLGVIAKQLSDAINLLDTAKINRLQGRDVNSSLEAVKQTIQIALLSTEPQKIIHSPSGFRKT